MSKKIIDIERYFKIPVLLSLVDFVKLFETQNKIIIYNSS